MREASINNTVGMPPYHHLVLLTIICSYRTSRAGSKRRKVLVGAATYRRSDTGT